MCWTRTATVFETQNGKYVFNAVPTTDWGSPETLEHWREDMGGDVQRQVCGERGLMFVSTTEAMSVRAWSLLPTVHEGATVRAMEKKGIRTEKGRVQPLDQERPMPLSRTSEKKIALLFDWIAGDKSGACQAAGTRPCFSAERLLHPAKSRGIFAKRQNQQSERR